MLDDKLSSMEITLNLFSGFLVNKKRKSSMVNLYISAIKAILDVDGHPINEDRATLNAMTKACKIHNDIMAIRFPIKRA